MPVEEVRDHELVDDIVQEDVELADVFMDHRYRSGSQVEPVRSERLRGGGGQREDDLNQYEGRTDASHRVPPISEADGRMASLGQASPPSIMHLRFLPYAPRATLAGPRRPCHGAVTALDQGGT